MSDDLLWDKPGPGTWNYDGTHNDGPKAHFLRELFPSAMADGFRSFTGRYGLPLSHVEVRFVNGYAYDTPRIAGVPAGDKPPPPTFVLRLLTRVHPEFRRRARNAQRALDGAVWRDDLDRWEGELRPARVAANVVLQAVLPESLDDTALTAHFDECVANLESGMREHFGLIGAATVPVGLHVLRSESPANAFAALSGAAAESTGATVAGLVAIADELEAQGVVASSLDDVRSASPRAAELLDRYLDEYGQRIISTYDVTGKRLIEMPELIVRSIMTARRSVSSSATVDGDALLADARRAFASRDDHAGVSGLWPMGLTRRALLEAGSRLAATGKLEHPDHVFDCMPAEVSTLLRGGTQPSASLIAKRVRDRARFAATTPPTRLGAEQAPPDPAAFAPAMRRMTEATMAALAMVTGSRPPQSGQSHAGGEGIGDRPHRGRAVVAHQAIDAIERLQPGDVLVTSMTTPAFNCVLPIVGALVTVHGGQFSHAGIVARELDIPTVLSVADALERIPDGAIVEVDPRSGTVTVVPG